MKRKKFIKDYICLASLSACRKNALAQVVKIREEKQRFQQQFFVCLKIMIRFKRKTFRGYGDKGINHKFLNMIRYSFMLLRVYYISCQGSIIEECGLAHTKSAHQRIVYMKLRKFSCEKARRAMTRGQLVCGLLNPYELIKDFLERRYWYSNYMRIERNS